MSSLGDHKSTPSISDYDRYLHELGDVLQSQDCGGYIKSEQDIVVYIYRLPTSCPVDFIVPGVLLLENSKLLRGLCEMSDLARGFSSKWNCKKKGDRRLFASCTYSGSPSKSRSKGIRDRSSRK